MAGAHLTRSGVTKKKKKTLMQPASAQFPSIRTASGTPHTVWCNIKNAYTVTHDV